MCRKLARFFRASAFLIWSTHVSSVGTTWFRYPLKWTLWANISCYPPTISPLDATGNIKFVSTIQFIFVQSTISRIFYSISWVNPVQCKRIRFKIRFVSTKLSHWNLIQKFYLSWEKLLKFFEKLVKSGILNMFWIIKISPFVGELSSAFSFAS